MQRQVPHSSCLNLLQLDLKQLLQSAYESLSDKWESLSECSGAKSALSISAEIFVFCCALLCLLIM